MARTAKIKTATNGANLGFEAQPDHPQRDDRR